MSSAVERKKAVVEELAEKLGSAKAFYLTDFTGLDVKKMTDLRARMRQEGVEYLVVKNTLALRAVEGLDIPDIGEFFEGPTGLVIGADDPVAAAKVLDTFARENDAKPSVKVGVVDRRQVTPDDVERLAKLPPREQLLAELLGVMQAPMATLVLLMQAKARELVGLLEALRAEREEGA